jgi:DNA-binding response OmpR family regulator
MDFALQTAILDAERMTLTRKEYDLLALLVQHAGEIIPRDALLMQVWGYGAEIRTRTLDVHVRRLRKKLGGYADQYIETIFGIGYRFQPYHAPRFFQPHGVRPAIAISA